MTGGVFHLASWPCNMMPCSLKKDVLKSLFSDVTGDLSTSSYTVYVCLPNHKNHGPSQWPTGFEGLCFPQVSDMMSSTKSHNLPLTATCCDQRMFWFSLIHQNYSNLFWCVFCFHCFHPSSSDGVFPTFSPSFSPAHKHLNNTSKDSVLLNRDPERILLIRW